MKPYVSSDSDIDTSDVDDDASSKAYADLYSNKELYVVACSPIDALLVATGGGDCKVFLWKIGQANFVFELQGHKNSISTLAFSADGRLLASGSLDGLIQVWDTSSCSLKGVLEGPIQGIQWLRWHPSEHLILAASIDSIVWMWSADKNICLNTFSGHGSAINDGDFTPDGKNICTASYDGSLRIWNPKTGENIHVVRGHPDITMGLLCLAITSDSTLAITGSVDGSVYVVNIITGKLIGSLKAHSLPIACVGLSPSFPRAAIGSDLKLIIWDLQNSSPRCICDHEEPVTCLEWIGTSKYIATGSTEGKVRVWDSLSGKCVKTISGHSNIISSLAISANRQFLVSVSMDETAQVFEIAEFQ